jgi:hypothetical protein
MKATVKTLRRAWDQCAGKIAKDETVFGVERDAGMLTTANGEEWQVFVAMNFFSQELLDDDPDSGGLWVNVMRKRNWAKEQERMLAMLKAATSGLNKTSPRRKKLESLQRRLKRWAYPG